MTDIIVDPRFRDKIPKPSEEERRRLEENILSDGLVREPLVLWAGTKILVDGHNRWDIIQRHPDIPYTTIEHEFDNEWDVIAWICRNQLGRRNISKVVYDKLIQEEHDAVQKIPGGDHKSDVFKNQSAQNAQLESTRAVVAKEHGITQAYVERAVEFGRGLDAGDEVAPGLKDAVLSGEESYGKREIADLRKIEDPQKRKAAVEEMRSPKVKFPSGQSGKSKNLSPEAQEIAEQDKRTTDKNAVVEYGIEDLLEDLRLLQEDFIDKYHHAIDLHMDVATDNGRKVLNLMKEFDAEWREVKEKFK